MIVLKRRIAAVLHPAIFFLLACIVPDAVLQANSPARAWNTFIGGMSLDYGMAVAVGPDGSVYVAGQSYWEWGTPVRSFSGGSDAFVAKLSSSGAPLWHTYLGSSSDDNALGITVDGNGNVYVTGESVAAWGTPQHPFSGGRDAFVARISSAGTLLWHTFLGSTADDWGGYGIAVDGNGNVSVCGHSYDTWGSPLRAYSGGSDMFVARLNSLGVLQWNTFLGGAEGDTGGGLEIDTAGDIFVTGDSRASWGSPVRAFSTAVDGFVARLDNSGTLRWNTFFGGSGNDGGLGIAVGGDRVFVSGSSTAAWGSPVRAYAGDQDAVILCLNGDGSLAWNTFLGSEYYDHGWGITWDSRGEICVSGGSFASWDLPVDPFSGFYDGFAAGLSGGGQLLWHTFYGSENPDMGAGIAIAGDGSLYTVGTCMASWGSPVSGFVDALDACVLKFCHPVPPTVTVTPSPAVTPGGEPHTVYLGYGPQSITIQAAGAGGTSFAWAPSEFLNDPYSASPVFTPATEGIYTYTVTVANQDGCTASASVTIVVTDVRDPLHSGKVIVCHEGKSISIDEHAVQAHLDHGDRLGPCIPKSPNQPDQLPVTLRLEQNYPNPFNPVTTITYATPCDGVVRLTVYDIHGRLVEELVAGDKTAGTHTVRFDGSRLPSGTYRYRLETAGFVLANEMILMK